MSVVIFRENIDDKIKRLLQGYYDVDYYTTAEIELYMGDTKIEDVVSLEYSLVNNKTPLYGIFSRYYDAVAKGTIIVKGSLAIAFRQTNYLTYLYQKHQNRAPYRIEVEQSSNMERVYKLIKNGDYKAASQYFDDELRIFMRALINGDYEVVKEKYNEVLERGDNEKLKVYKKMLTDFYWGNLNVNTFLSNKISEEFRNTYYETPIIKGLKRADELDLELFGFGYGMEYSTILSGFELYITYGYNDNFKLNKNVKLINDVHIFSEAQSLQVTDEPVIEIYQFFARGIDIVEI